MPHLSPACARFGQPREQLFPAPPLGATHSQPEMQPMRGGGGAVQAAPGGGVGSAAAHGSCPRPHAPSLLQFHHLSARDDAGCSRAAAALDACPTAPPLPRTLRPNVSCWVLLPLLTCCLALHVCARQRQRQEVRRGLVGALLCASLAGPLLLGCLTDRRGASWKGPMVWGHPACLKGPSCTQVPPVAWCGHSCFPGLRWG